MIDSVCFLPKQELSLRESSIHKNNYLELVELIR